MKFIKAWLTALGVISVIVVIFTLAGIVAVSAVDGQDRTAVAAGVALFLILTTLIGFGLYKDGGN